MTNVNQNRKSWIVSFPFLCGIFALVAFCLSMVAEYLWKIEACRLCKIERSIYAGILIFSTFGLWQRFKTLAKGVVLFLLVTLMLLSSYHLLIQWGLFTDPCAVPNDIATLEDFQKMLDSPLPCSKIAWQFFGLPVSAYNLGFSVFFLSYFRKVHPKDPSKRD
jgi:disulfide bond formation protein DsbB